MTPAARLRELNHQRKVLRFALRWLLRRYDADAGDRHRVRMHAINVLANTRRVPK